MKSFKKIVLSLCICLLVIATFFGCTFVSVNDSKYYTQIVASVKLTDNTVLTVNVRELLDGLTNFGYQNYFQSASDDKAYTEGIKQTVNTLISRKIILHIAKNDDNYKITLTDYDKKSAMKSAIDSVNTSLTSNEQAIREKKGIEDLEEKTPEEETASAKEYTPYEKKIVKADVNGNGLIEPNEFKYITTPKKENDQAILAMDLNKTVLENFRFTSIGNDLAASPDDKEVFFEAKFALFKNLRTYYENLGEKGLTDNQLLEKQLNTMYEGSLDDALLAKMQEVYDKSQTEGANAFLTINSQIVNLFRQKYVLEKNKYQTAAAIDSYRDGLKTSSTSTENYYVPVTGEYFLVQHILLKYSNEQTKEIEAQKKLLDKGYIEQEDYDAFVESMAQQISVNGKSYSTIADEINGYCGTATTTALGIDAKALLFRDKMFEYTGDDATLNAEGDYIIPTKKYNDKNNNGKEDEGESLDSMVEPFANMSRQIRTECLNEGAGRVGKISEPVLSEFGWHIIMYVGDYENKFSNLNIDNINLTDEQNILNIANILYNTNIKAGHNKTYYDSLYTNVTLNNFGTMATNLISSSQKETIWENPIIKDIVKRFIK